MLFRPPSAILQAQADRASVVHVTSSYNNSHKLGHFGHLKIIIEFTGRAIASVHVFDKIRLSRFVVQGTIIISFGNFMPEFH
jgi:hypothetical protein